MAISRGRQAALDDNYKEQLQQQLLQQQRLINQQQWELQQRQVEQQREQQLEQQRRLVLQQQTPQQTLLAQQQQLDPKVLLAAGLTEIAPGIFREESGAILYRSVSIGRSPHRSRPGVVVCYYEAVATGKKIFSNQWSDVPCPSLVFDNPLTKTMRDNSADKRPRPPQD
jgi:hypothetical protein